MKSFIRIKESIEEFLATVLVIMAPIACIFVFLAWVFSLMGFTHVSNTIDYITYDIIAPVFTIVSVVALVIWAPHLIWNLLSYLFKRIKKAWKN
jgi:hypothetical protein